MGRRTTLAVLIIDKDLELDYSLENPRSRKKPGVVRSSTREGLVSDDVRSHRPSGLEMPFCPAEALTWEAAWSCARC